MNKGKELVNTTPNDLKRLRACIHCHLIKTEEQFKETGCENCNISMLDQDTMFDNTSANFEGMISLVDPQHSWVARANNLSNEIVTSSLL